MTLRQWIKTPKGYVAIILFTYLVIASMWTMDKLAIVNSLIAVGTALIVDVICSLIRRSKRIFPDGTVITGLIVALVLSTTTPWAIVAATSAISILSKHVFKYRKKPIFNPAAFGLLLSIILFDTDQSWWGAFGDLPALSMLLLLVGGYIVTNRVNKFPQVFSFLGVSFLLLLLCALLDIGQAGDALRAPFINSTLFFGFFMLTDLPTSPAKVKDQIMFGMITAVVGTVILIAFNGLMYLLVGLLLANLYHLLRVRSNSAASGSVRAQVSNNRAGSKA